MRLISMIIIFLLVVLPVLAVEQCKNAAGEDSVCMTPQEAQKLLDGFKNSIILQQIKDQQERVITDQDAVIGTQRSSITGLTNLNKLLEDENTTLKTRTSTPSWIWYALSGVAGALLSGGIAVGVLAAQKKL